MKTREFTLVINLVNFPSKWQFRLKNENIEISGNSAKLRKGDSRWLCWGWVFSPPMNPIRNRQTSLARFLNSGQNCIGHNEKLTDLEIHFESKIGCYWQIFPWFLRFEVGSIFWGWKSMVELVLIKVTSIFICTKWIILQEKNGFWASPIYISKYFR